MFVKSRKTLTQRLIAALVVVAALALASTGFCKPAKLGRLLMREEVATAWIGLSEDELYLVRIDLGGSSRRSLGYAFLNDAPVVYSIGSWTYDPSMGSRIRIELQPPVDPPIALAGDIVGVKMELTMSRDDWSRRVSLRRESDLQPRWQRLVDLMGANR